MVEVTQGLSIARGIPLAEEQGIGPLTLGGFLREVTQRHGPAEAAVIHLDGRVERWTYDDLWARSRTRSISGPGAMTISTAKYGKRVLSSERSGSATGEATFSVSPTTSNGSSRCDSA